MKSIGLDDNGSGKKKDEIEDNMMLLAFTAEKTEARKERKQSRLDDKLFLDVSGNGICR